MASKINKKNNLKLHKAELIENKSALKYLTGFRLRMAYEEILEVELPNEIAIKLLNVIREISEEIQEIEDRNDYIIFGLVELSDRSKNKKTK